MKLILLLAAVVLLAYAEGKAVSIYNDIEEFKQKNPGAKLIKLDYQDHELSASRSYTLGGRQTGKVNKPDASDIKLIAKFF